MNPVKNKIAKSGPAIGTWVGLASPTGAETLGRAGFDFLLLDAQHAGVTWDNMVHLLQAVAISGTPSVVRVGWNDPALIMRALDLGATGVVIPMVSTPAEAARAAAATRYPPLGNRSFGPLRNGATPDEANANVLCLPMVETAESLEHLEAIITTPGVDGVFIGPMDLALSLGHALDYGAFHPSVLQAVDDVVRLCHAHGKLAGTVSMNPSVTEDLLGRGIDFLTVGSDGGYVMQGARSDLEHVRSWLENNKGVTA
jgi:4-hydroxy-2-oxoheptanedioate aldolase